MVRTVDKTIINLYHHKDGGMTQYVKRLNLWHNTLEDLWDFLNDVGSTPSHWQKMQWTIDDEPSEEQPKPCGFSKWKKIVTSIHTTALRHQNEKDECDIVIHLYSKPQKAPEPPEPPKPERTRRSRYMSQTDALDAIYSLFKFSPDFSKQHNSDFIYIHDALDENFKDKTARHKAVELFQRMLTHLQTHAPQAGDQQELQAHVTLLHKLIKTLQRRRRRRRYMSKTKALKAIDRLIELFPDDRDRRAELISFQHTLAMGFSNQNARRNTVPFFQEILHELETTTPHANEPHKLQAHLSLLHKLIHTLQRTRRRRRRKPTGEWV